MADERSLDDGALTRLRTSLAEGKRPSVVLLRGGNGLPAGSRGQLLRIDDPPVDAEFLHVKVGGDELPFSPEELALPGRGSRTKSPMAPAADPPATNSVTPPPGPTLRAVEPILEPTPADRRGRADRVTTPSPAPSEPTVPAADPPAADRTAAAGRPTKRAARTPGGPPKVTLTLRFADFRWTVEALVGGRRDKPQPLSLAAVRALADQLDDQGLRRALEATVEACRSEAVKKAATLRAELARLETELAALDD